MFDENESSQASTQPPDEEVQQLDSVVTPWGSIHTSNPLLSNYEITENSITIGRAKSCTIRVSDLRISSVHCIIFLKTEKNSSEVAFIEDKRYDLIFYL